MKKTPKRGEFWIIRLKGAGACMIVKVEEISSATAQLQECQWTSLDGSIYERCDVKFVERTTEERWRTQR